MRRAPALLGLLASLALGGAVHAQTERGSATNICRLPVLPREAGVLPEPPHAAVRKAPDCDPATEGARFEVTYTGFPAGAEASFQDAVDVWSCRIQSDQVIRIAASWSPLEQGTLGSAGPVLYRNFDAAPARDVWYASALADALARRDLGQGDADIEAFFNSDFPDWHTGSGPPPAGTYDLTTVVLHEIGHGLGFIGALTVEDGLGLIQPDVGAPFSYDLHTRAASGTPLLDASTFPNRSVALAAALQGDVTFAGRATDQAIGRPLPLFSPDRWVQGGSYSHLDEGAFARGTPDGLMTPFIARDESIPEPGTAVCAVLADVGWTLAGDCAARVGGLVPVASGLQIERLGPNPFSSRTTLRLTLGQAAAVRVRVIDVRGRVVSQVGSRVLVAGEPWDLDIDGASLASGVYVVEVHGTTETVRIPLTVAR